MCGIAGVLDRADCPPDPALLQRMGCALVHRGPDDQGVLVDGGLGLVHRRLSIIDLAGGHQPMCDVNRRAWICFNGEIYNYRELRAELEGSGYCFATDSDTEVLINLYLDRGPRMLDSLIGMFAFSLWDSENRRLLVARDRFGQKPLFYSFRAGRFVFASELGALVCDPSVSRDLRLQSVHDYLTYQYIPSPHTVYREVLKLPPAAYLLIEPGQDSVPQPVRYWRPESRVEPWTPAAAAEAFRAHFLESVRLRLVADVPLGAFLSGGLDSGATVAAMARVSTGTVHTFTIGFPERKYDERDQAALVASHLGTAHLVREVDPGDFGVVRDLVRHYGEPYSDASMLPTYLLSRFAREHVKTALSGDGADELFGGYNRYLVMAAFRGLDLVPLSWRRALSRLLQALLPARREERTVGSQVRRLAELLGSSGEADRYLDLISRFPESLKQRVYGERLAGVDLTESQALMRQAFADLLSWDPRSRVAQVDVGTYLPGDILTKVDIASMAASLEVRSPFLDHRLAEFAWSLPWSLKQRLPLSRKRVIRHAVADWLPREVVTCGKLGFGVPLARWFRGRWQEHLRDVLLGHTARERGILDARAVECLIREHVDGVTDHSYSLWALLVLELWFQEAGVS